MINAWSVLMLTFSVILTSHRAYSSTVSTDEGRQKLVALRDLLESPLRMMSEWELHVLDEGLATAARQVKAAEDLFPDPDVLLCARDFFQVKFPGRDYQEYIMNLTKPFNFAQARLFLRSANIFDSWNVEWSISFFEDLKGCVEGHQKCFHDCLRMADFFAFLSKVVKGKKLTEMQACRIIKLSPLVMSIGLFTMTRRAWFYRHIGPFTEAELNAVCGWKGSYLALHYLSTSTIHRYSRYFKRSSLMNDDRFQRLLCALHPKLLFKGSVMSTKYHALAIAFEYPDYTTNMIGLNDQIEKEGLHELASRFDYDNQRFIRHCLKTGEYPELHFFCGLDAQHASRSIGANGRRDSDIPVVLAFLNNALQKGAYDEAKVLAFIIFRSKGFLNFDSIQQDRLRQQILKLFWDVAAFNEFDELVNVIGYESTCDYLGPFRVEHLKHLNGMFGPARDLIDAQDTNGGLLVKFAEIMLNDRAREAISRDMQFFGCWSVPHINYSINRVRNVHLIQIEGKCAWLPDGNSTGMNVTWHQLFSPGLLFVLAVLSAYYLFAQ